MTDIIDADPGEEVGHFADRLLTLARATLKPVTGRHNSRLMTARLGDTRRQLLAQWDAQAPRDEPLEPAALPDDRLKLEVSRLAESIFRRIEFDGSLHKSSLEDELYRWAKDVLGERETTGFVATEKYEKLLRDDTAWAEAAKKMQRKKEQEVYAIGDGSEELPLLITQSQFRGLAARGHFEPARPENDTIGCHWWGADNLYYRVVKG